MMTLRRSYGLPSRLIQPAFSMRASRAAMPPEETAVISNNWVGVRTKSPPERRDAAKTSNSPGDNPKDSIVGATPSRWTRRAASPSWLNVSMAVRSPSSGISRRYWATMNSL